MPRATTAEFQYGAHAPRWERRRLPASRGARTAKRPIEARAARANAALTKRLFDVAVSATAILFMIPLILAVAVLIKAESRGPVFFRQTRYGVRQRPFSIYKFRSMSVLESEGAFQQAVAGDARVTRVGRFLRRSSLDEMPQLLNVVMGDMSLVGPRPHATAMDDTFGEIVADYPDRFLVRPGLTGLAQVTGCRGPTDTFDKIARRIAFDRAYIRRWSPLLDVAIIARTPICLVRDPNAL